MTRKIIYHIIIPILVPALFFGIAAMPVNMTGSHIQAMSLLAIAFIGALAALGSGVTAVKRRFLGGGNTGWWVVTSLILAVPAVALLGWG